MENVMSEEIECPNCNCKAAKFIDSTRRQCLNCGNVYQIIVGSPIPDRGSAADVNPALDAR